MQFQYSFFFKECDFDAACSILVVQLYTQLPWQISLFTRFEPVGNGCNCPEGQSGLIRWRIRRYGANWTVSGIGQLCCGFYCNILVMLLLALLKSHISHGGKKMGLWFRLRCLGAILDSHIRPQFQIPLFQCRANFRGHKAIGDEKMAEFECPGAVFITFSRFHRPNARRIGAREKHHSWYSAKLTVLSLLVRDAVAGWCTRICC